MNKIRFRVGREIIYNFKIINMSAPFYYDKPTFFNSLNFKKKKGTKNEFGIELEGIVPPEGEIRLLGNRHKQCTYYSIGVDGIKYVSYINAKG